MVVKNLEHHNALGVILQVRMMGFGTQKVEGMREQALAPSSLLGQGQVAATTMLPFPPLFLPTNTSCPPSHTKKSAGWLVTPPYW